MVSAVADLYGIAPRAAFINSSEFKVGKANDSIRTGLLGHPLFLSYFGKSSQSDPIHRGLLVREKLLCGEILPPPPEVEAEPELE